MGGKGEKWGGIEMSSYGGEGERENISFGNSVSLSEEGTVFSSFFIPTDKYKHFGP